LKKTVQIVTLLRQNNCALRHLVCAVRPLSRCFCGFFYANNPKNQRLVMDPIPVLVAVVVIAWLVFGFFSVLWLKFRQDDQARRFEEIERRVARLENRASFSTVEAHTRQYK
jgi:heme/copper-type cytochrome/quinol oxidase subunit 2